jgi:hypothetical protein
MKNFKAYQLSKSFYLGTNKQINMDLPDVENSPGGGGNKPTNLFKYISITLDINGF